MAITVVQHNSGKDGASTTNPALTVGLSATGAGNLLFVAILLFNSTQRTVASVVDSNGNSFIRFAGTDHQITTGPYAGVTYDIWYLASSTAGATSVTMTANAQPITFKEYAVYEVSGITTVAVDGTPVYNDNKASVGTTFTGEAITTSGASGVAAAFCADVNATQNPKTGNAFNAGGEQFSGGSDATISMISAAAGTYTPEWVGTANPNFSTFTFAFKETAGATGGSVFQAVSRLVARKDRHKSKRRRAA